jgi:Proton-conducting membrane transporter
MNIRLYIFLFVHIVAFFFLLRTLAPSRIGNRVRVVHILLGLTAAGYAASSTLSPEFLVIFILCASVACLVAAGNPRTAYKGSDSALTVVIFSATLFVWMRYSTSLTFLLVGIQQILMVWEEWRESQSNYDDERKDARTALILINSCLVIGGYGAYWLHDFLGIMPERYALGGLLIAAAAAVGLFPLHSSSIAFLSRPRLKALYPLSSTSVGLYLLYAELLPYSENFALIGQFLKWSGSLGLLYCSLLLFGEFRLKRIIAYLYLSAISVLALLFGFSGITTPELQLSLAVANIIIATTGLILVSCVLTSRFGMEGVIALTGISTLFPLAGVCFLISTLSLVGFPGTFGFLSEEMIISSIRENTFLFLVFVVAMTLNGFSCFRIFGKVFGGSPQFQSQQSLELMRKERVAFAGIILLLVVNGLLPTIILKLLRP